MKKWKHIMAYLLTICMILGLVYSPAKAADEQEMTLTFSSGAAQDGSTRYLIYFDVEGTTLESTLPNESDTNSYWNNNTIYVDGVAKSGSGVNYSITSNEGTQKRQVFLCLQYSVLESGVYSGSQMGSHLIHIPAGTVIGGLKTTTDLNISVNGTSVSEAKGVNFTFSSGAAQDAATRYLFYFDVSGVSGLTNKYWNGNKVLIDGVETEVHFQPSNINDSSCTEMLMIISYDLVNAGATVASDVGIHTISIPVGTTIGDLTLLNGVNLIVGNSSVSEAKEKNFGLGENGAQDALSRYLIRLTVDEVPSSAFLSGNTVYIDGQKVTGISYADLGEAGSIAMVLPYSKIPNVESTTTAGSIGSHTLQIPKGSAVCNFVAAESLTLEIDGWSITQKNYAKISLAQVQCQEGTAQRYVISLNLDGVDASSLTDLYWNNNTVYIDNVAKSGDGVNYLPGDGYLKLYLTYEQVQSGATSYEDITTHLLKIPAGTVLGSGSAFPITVENDLFIQLTGGTGNQLESDPSVRNEVTVTAQNDRRNGDRNMGSIYLNTTGSPDPLPYSADWNTRYSFTEGGVYYNGTLQSSAMLVKILNYLYYVNIDACGITWQNGDVLTIDGMVANGSDDVIFEKVSFIRNADGSFSQYDENAESLEKVVQLEDVYVNADVDTYTIPSAPLLLNGSVSVKVNGTETTDYVLNEVGEYAIERAVENVVHSAVSGPKGDIIYQQNVILYKQGDADGNALAEIKDIIRIKKMASGAAGTDTQQKAADLDCNDVIDGAEDTALLRKLLAGELTAEEIYEDAEDEVVIGVISDMHYDTNYDAQRRVNTRKALNYYKSHNAKIIFFNGDVSDLGTEKSYEKLVADIIDVYPDAETRPKMILVGDNHEWHEAWVNVNGYTGTLTYPEVQDIFTNGLSTIRDKVTIDDGEGTNSHTTWNGYHFIGISSDGMSGASATYDADTVAWLTEHLDAAVAEDPNKPVFVGIHQPPKDTVVASDKEFSEQLNGILEQYPQAVVFSSHTHQTIEQETSFWQGAYTVINTGALFYQGGAGYNPALTIDPTQQFAQGLLVKVGGSSVDVERCDFWDDTVIGEN